MSDQDEDQDERRVIALVLGVAVVLAIVVSLLSGYLGFTQSGDSSAKAPAAVPVVQSAPAAPVRAEPPAVPAVPAPAPAPIVPPPAAVAAPAPAPTSAPTPVPAAPIAEVPAQRPTPAPEVRTAEVATPRVAASTGLVKLYFATGRSALPRDWRRTLAPIVEAVRSGRADRAVVTGFHDASGSAATNAAISRSRALAVAGALERLGLKKSEIDLRKPAAELPSGGTSNQEYRRVEVRADKR